MKKLITLFLMFLLFLGLNSCEFGTKTEEKILECDFYDEIYVGEELTIDYESSSPVTITSSDDEIIKVTDGTIKALKSGNTTITIKNNDLEKSFDVLVKDATLSSKVNYLKVTNEEEIDLNQYFETNLSLTFKETIGSQNINCNYVTIDNGYLKVSNLLENAYISNAIQASFTVRDIKLSASIDLLIVSDEELLIQFAAQNDLTVGDESIIEASSVFSNDQLTFTSNDAAIVELNGNMMKAKASGSAIITIYSTLLDQAISFNVNVKEKIAYPADQKRLVGVYLGLNNYGTETNSNLDNFSFKFSVEGVTKLYKLKKVGNYELHNLLEEGKLYELTLDTTTITNLIKLDDEEPFTSPKQSSIVEGIIESIDQYSVSIHGVNYLLIENPTYGNIQKSAGSSQCLAYTPTVGDNVLIVLTNNQNCQGIFKEKAIKDYNLPIEGVAGVRTITNFLRTALSAVGHALYVYGGSWDYQDAGSSNQARTIGVAESWVEFFYEHDASYAFKDTANHAKTYYPFGAFNEYYYAGVDCSGFVGWVTYNVMNTESGNEGYVMSSTKMAKNFESRGWGTFEKSATSANLLPGDVVSISGHVWLCLGVCSDGSIVIIHSTPSNSKSGAAGGGAQLGAIGNSTTCEAYQLANTYNQRYYPDWSARYNTTLKDFSSYLNTSNSNAGKFSWSRTSNGLTDPDDLTNKTPAEILKILFNE